MDGWMSQLIGRVAALLGRPRSDARRSVAGRAPSRTIRAAQTRGRANLEALESRNLLATSTGGAPFQSLFGTVTEVGRPVEVSTSVTVSRVDDPDGPGSPLLLNAEVRDDPNGADARVVRVTSSATPQITRPAGSSTYRIPTAATGPRTTDVAITVRPINGTIGDFNVDLTLAGDTDGNGAVDQTDLDRVLAAYGSREGEANFDAAADLNNDGRVGDIDRRDARHNLGARITFTPTTPPAPPAPPFIPIPVPVAPAPAPPPAPAPAPVAATQVAVVPVATPTFVVAAPQAPVAPTYLVAAPQAPVAPTYFVAAPQQPNAVAVAPTQVATVSVPSPGFVIAAPAEVTAPVATTGYLVTNPPSTTLNGGYYPVQPTTIAASGATTPVYYTTPGAAVAPTTATGPVYYTVPAQGAAAGPVYYTTPNASGAPIYYGSPGSVVQGPLYYSTTPTAAAVTAVPTTTTAVPAGPLAVWPGTTGKF